MFQFPLSYVGALQVQLSSIKCIFFGSFCVAVLHYSVFICNISFTVSFLFHLWFVVVCFFLFCLMMYPYGRDFMWSIFFTVVLLWGCGRGMDKKICGLIFYIIINIMLLFTPFIIIMLIYITIYHTCIIINDHWYCNYISWKKERKKERKYVMGIVSVHPTI